ncbi:DUF6182 family protein [Streptosporangium sp. NPDC002721]|uniref:DUF6182 family protein n=1 Tax=Streptosporangium sp. NPDC002721 TaxID=3366188 RepID=UPI0036BE160C
MTTPFQQLLHAEHTRRAARALADTGGVGGVPRVAAVAVVRDFTPASFAHSALAFAHLLAPEQRALWYASFTRTVYLAGDPHNLRFRQSPIHVSDNGEIAWFAPFPRPEHEVLLRMLRPFQAPHRIGAAPTDPVPLPCSTASAALARLDIPTANLSILDYAVHVNHLLAESLFDGLLIDASAIRIRHLSRTPVLIGYDRLRVAPDPAFPHLLRAYACLALPTDAGTDDQSEQAESQTDDTCYFRPSAGPCSR